MSTTVTEKPTVSDAGVDKRPKRARKPEGQWKIDGTAPLNHVEEVKQEEDVLAVKQRVIDIYSKQGFDSIPADDLAPRFKWLGIYTQRRQDLGGELTGQVPDAELQDKYLMMRVRFDGGLAFPERLRAVGEISRDYARSTADFTDRQNIQLHWIRIEDVPDARIELHKPVYLARVTTEHVVISPEHIAYYWFDADQVESRLHWDSNRESFRQVLNYSRLPC